MSSLINSDTLQSHTNNMTINTSISITESFQNPPSMVWLSLSKSNGYWNSDGTLEQWRWCFDILKRRWRGGSGIHSSPLQSCAPPWLEVFLSERRAGSLYFHTDKEGINLCKPDQMETDLLFKTFLMIFKFFLYMFMWKINL